MTFSQYEAVKLFTYCIFYSDGRSYFFLTQPKCVPLGEIISFLAFVLLSGLPKSQITESKQAE